MTEASFIQYLDEEYQRIQEYLSSLVDTIPVINLDAIQDADSLIISLVDQNKAYGNQIISLYKTLDSVTGAKSLHETSENPGSLTNLDSVNRLQDKLKQYEDLIQELSSENEGLFSQIRELSLQVKTIQAKQEHQQNLSMISQIHHADITAVNQPPKTTVSSARTTLVHSPNELSFDLENLFILGEVRKASEVLTQMEYRKPHHVTIEKYNSWLIKSNKVKDLEIHEALTKLKSIVEAIEYEGDQVKEQKRQSYEFEDSLDHANVSPLEKVMTQLEEKLGKVLIHNEQLRLANASQLESSRYTRGGYDRFRNSEIKEAAEHLETENGMNTEILHDKVKFLRENLEDMERELREKHAEVEILKERLEKVKSGHSRPGSVTGNENLMKELENEMKARNQAEDKLQEVVSENEELRNAYDVAKKQNETCNRRIKDLYEQLNEKDQIIDKFVRDNEQIRKNKSSLHDSNMLEQLKTDLSFKNSEISQLSRDITHLKDNRKVNAEPKSTTRRAIPQTTDDAEGSTQRLRDVSALEAALHTQEDLLFHLKQASKESKEYLIEALKKSQLDLPQVSENKLRDEPSSPTTEAQRIIKENNQIIQELIKEAHFLKVGNQMLITPSTKRQNTSRAGDFSDMLNKLHQEEDKLIEKLSRSLKVLSQLRTSVCDILVASEDPHYLNNPALVFLQDLYTNINQVLQSLQGLSSEFAVIEKKDSENDQQVSEQKRIPKSIKDQLIRDQNELKDRLQVFAQNLNTEENHDRLSQDQEINQSLYKQLLEKDVIINEIIILFTEGLERTNESISQLAKIADSEDAFVLVGDVLNEVDVMKTKLKELVAFEQGEKPQITSNTENDEIYRRSEPRVEEHVEGDDNQDEGDVNDEVEEEIQEEEENANEHILMKLQELERENWDLKEYKNSADATLKKLQDQNSKLKMMYFTEINAVKEEQKALLEERRQLRNDVEKKGQEVTKLNQILESLQTFSNKQLEVVKDKEQKLQALTGQKKDSDQWMKDLEKKIEDFVKEKKQYEEVIAKKDEEIDLLKRESIETMQRYIELQEQHKELNHKFSEVVERIKILEEERELLVGGKTEIESKVKKLNELLQVTRNELRNCRQLVEEKNYDIEQMEDEIRSLKEAIKKERSLNKESDFVMHLKSELKSQNTELEVLKKKYSEILKLNEFLQSDVHTPTGVTRRNDQFIKELDKSSTYIRETPETVDAFQKSLKRRDAASSIEKSGYLNDSRQMHRNMSVSESNWNIEGYAKDHKNSMVLNSEPRHSKVSNIAISRDGGGHSRKISMLDEKDLEIQRLTNVLRDLTKSLGISQEAKKNIINTRMQKSSVLE